MKCTESRELRNLSMNQLNAKLSELYKELPSCKWAFERRYRQHILNLINQIKHEQTLRRKGLRTQGVWITTFSTQTGRFRSGYSTSNVPKQINNMDIITKELFDKYLKLQRSGIMNMTDIERGARILRCTHDEYETILWNYTTLKNKFYPKHQ